MVFPDDKKYIAPKNEYQQKNQNKYKLSERLEILNIIGSINILIDSLTHEKECDELKNKLFGVFKAVQAEIYHMEIIFNSATDEEYERIIVEEVAYNRLNKIAELIGHTYENINLDNRVPEKYEFYAKSILVELERWIEVIEIEVYQETKLNTKSNLNPDAIIKTLPVQSEKTDQELKKTLMSIKKSYRNLIKGDGPRCVLYILDAKKNTDAINFLNHMACHLKLAGVNVSSETLNNKSVMDFFNSSEFNDHLILIASSDYLTDNKQNFSSFCDSLSKVKRDRHTESRLSSKVSLLLLDKNKFKFEKYYSLYMESNWGGFSYVTYLKNLLRRLYIISRINIEYDKSWRFFDESEDNQLILHNCEKINEDRDLVQEYCTKEELKDDATESDRIQFGTSDEKFMLSDKLFEITNTAEALEEEKMEENVFDETLEMARNYRNHGSIDLDKMKSFLNELVIKKSSQLPKVSELLNNVDITHKSMGSKTLLHIASERGDNEMVKILLKLTKKLVTLKDDVGNTALHYSAKYDFKEITSMLMLAGADENSKNKCGYSPIEISAINNSLMSMRIFSIKPNSSSSYKYALYYAIQKRNIEIIQEILFFSSFKLNEINETLKFEEFTTTYLCYTCELGFQDVFDILIKIPGIDVSVSKLFLDEFKLQLTPLLLAIQNGRDEIIDCLLKLQVSDPSVYTFYLATLHENKKLLEKLLFACRCDLNLAITAEQDKRNKGDRVFAAACRVGNVEIIKLLLMYAKQFGIDLNANGKDGLPPLFVACQKENIEVMKVLLLRNDIKLKTNKGVPIMHFAMQNKNYKITKWLMEDILQSHINMTDEKGSSLLHLICQSGNNELFDLICLNEQAFHIPDAENCYPIFYLIKNNHLNMFIKLFTGNPDQSITLTADDTPALNASFFAIQFDSFDIYHWIIDNVVSEYRSEEKEYFYVTLLKRLISKITEKNDFIETLGLLKNQIHSDDGLEVKIKNRIFIRVIYNSIEFKKSDLGLVFLDTDNTEVNSFFEHGHDTLLYHACQKSSINLFNELLKCEYIDVNLGYKYKDQSVSLIFKLMSESLGEDAQLNLVKHSKLDMKKCKLVDGKKEFTILEKAIRSENVHFIKLLFDNIDGIERFFSKKDLFYAALMIQDNELAENHAVELKPNFKDEENLLIIAIRSAHYGVISGLLERYDFSDMPMDQKLPLLEEFEKSKGHVIMRFNPVIQELEKPVNKIFDNMVIKPGYGEKKAEKTNELQIAKKVIYETVNMPDISEGKKKNNLKLFLELIVDSKNNLSDFRNINFSVLAKCKNLAEVNNSTAFNKLSNRHIISLCSSLIEPQYSTFTFGYGNAQNCEETNTWKLLNKLKNAIDDALVEKLDIGIEVCQPSTSIG